MKTTYLVYKQVNGVRRLVVATPAAVSYTHLDVYKRQAFNSQRTRANNVDVARKKTFSQLLAASQITQR